MGFSSDFDPVAVSPMKNLKFWDGDFTTAILRVWGVGGGGKQSEAKVFDFFISFVTFRALVSATFGLKSVGAIYSLSQSYFRVRGSWADGPRVLD